MREFDPIDQNRNGLMDREPIPGDSADSGMTPFAIMLAIALALGIGAYFFSMSDNNQQVATNTTPAATAPVTPDSARPNTQ